jgi:hypothetical protein
MRVNRPPPPWPASRGPVGEQNQREHHDNEEAALHGEFLSGVDSCGTPVVTFSDGGMQAELGRASARGAGHLAPVPVANHVPGPYSVLHGYHPT